MLRSLVKRSLPYLPQSVRSVLRGHAESIRRKEHQERKQRVHVPVDEIIAKIKQLRVDRDVIVHASISNIGKLDKPVPALVSDLLASLDLSRQTILVPALPFATTMLEYAASTRTFDVRTAKNAMGVVSQVIGRQQGSMRSLHPTHSAIALGKDAAFYTADHEKDPTPFGENSPYAKLVRRHGQILLIGVSVNSTTTFHVYEDMLGASSPIQVYSPGTITFTLVGLDGQSLEYKAVCHDSRLSARRDPNLFRQWLEAAGAIRFAPIGESEVSVIDAHLMTQMTLQRLSEGQSVYGRVTLDANHKVAIAAALERLESDV